MIKTPKFNTLKWMTMLIPIGIFWVYEISEHIIERDIPLDFIAELAFFTVSWILIVNYLFKRLLKSYHELKQSHEELASLKDYNEAIITNMPVGVITVDARGGINTINPIAEKQFDVSTTAMRGEDVYKIMGNLEDGSFSEALQETLVQRKLVEIDQVEFKPAKSHRRTLKIRIQPLTEREEINGAILMVEDISKNIELERQLIISRKLAAAAQLISGVTHRIKTPLTSIAINIRNIRDGLRLDNIPSDNIIKLAEMTDGEINYLNRTMREFLKQVHPTETKKIPSNITLILEDVLTFLSPIIEEHEINVLKDLNQTLPKLELGRRQIRETFFNIITNSIEAMPGGGTLKLKTFEDSQFVNIRIKDDGHGIDRLDMDKVFDFYFTTKEGGSGIGLSASFLTIDQHGGKITVESDRGKGTTIIIRLPIGKGSCHE
jgi:two-component system, sporulation sensor kinase E